jgi:hypothetical protein
MERVVLVGTSTGPSHSVPLSHDRPPRRDRRYPEGIDFGFMDPADCDGHCVLTHLQSPADRYEWRVLSAAPALPDERNAKTTWRCMERVVGTGPSHSVPCPTIGPRDRRYPPAANTHDQACVERPRRVARTAAADDDLWNARHNRQSIKPIVHPPGCSMCVAWTGGSHVQRGSTQRQREAVSCRTRQYGRQRPICALQRPHRPDDAPLTLALRDEDPFPTRAAIRSVGLEQPGQLTIALHTQSLPTPAW